MDMPSVIKIDITRMLLNYSCMRSHIVAFYSSSIDAGYISLHSAPLVPKNSFIIAMLVNILLFLYYSCQYYS